MRVGQNPAKSVKQVAEPERITVAVLNYIPFLSGFYASMLDVLKACLDSIRRTADLPFDLMVFDNGSCEEVQDYLVDERRKGHIQYLLLSEKNLGKGGAWNIILEAAPGEIVVYADNDCLFYPGWLSRSVQLLETFPRVGMVTARPFRTKDIYFTNTLKWAEEKEDVQVERGDFIPWEVFRDFDLSLGQAEADIRKRYGETEDVRLSYQGLQAIVGASHWQFAAWKKTLKEFLPFHMDRPMGQVKQLDERMNAAGYLRLMPVDPLVMNMSNTLPGEVKREEKRENKRLAYRFLDFSPVRFVLLKLYDSIFRWYYARHIKEQD